MDFPEFAKEEPELPSSDESDQDYVPSGPDSNLSEEESDGDIEEDSAAGGDGEMKNQRGKRSKGKTKTAKRKKYRHQKSKPANDISEENSDEKNEVESEKKKLSEEEAKVKADSIWQDFLKDTRPSSSQPSSSSKLTNGNSEPKHTEENKPTENKVKITKVFEFAGEEVRVEKEVPKDSAEARLCTSKTDISTSSPACSKKGTTPPAGRGGGLKGLSSVLGQLGKKPKLGTLEKSKLDWERFKRSEGIEEELQTHNKGKDGYLERQDFLQRADVRQFEIERDLRASRRGNR